MVRTAIAIGVVLTLGVLVGRLTRQPVARAQSGCSVASFKGSYAVSLSGFFYDANGFQGVYSSVGLAVADGTGAVSGTESLNLDGTPARGLQFSGTYTVNNDCSGSVSIKDPQGNVIADMDMVIANGGKTAALVTTDTDLILNGTATLQ